MIHKNHRKLHRRLAAGWLLQLTLLALCAAPLAANAQQSPTPTPTPGLPDIHLGGSVSLGSNNQLKDGIIRAATPKRTFQDKCIFDLQYTIENRPYFQLGVPRATGPFVSRLTNRFGNVTTLIATREDNLESGESKQVVYEIALYSGPQRLQLVLDATGQVEEVDETNNAQSVQVDVAAECVGLKEPARAAPPDKMIQPRPLR